MNGTSSSRTGRSDGERWALENPGHPLYDEVIAEVDARRTGYYGGYRGNFTLAYLVLSA